MCVCVCFVIIAKVKADVAAAPCGLSTPVRDRFIYIYIVLSFIIISELAIALCPLNMYATEIPQNTLLGVRYDTRFVDIRMWYEIGAPGPARLVRIPSSFYSTGRKSDGGCLSVNSDYTVNVFRTSARAIVERTFSRPKFSAGQFSTFTGHRRY